jgi:phenylacetic acid degradation operon negative regulatory protein
MALPAQSFILDLLSTLRRGTMPVSALVEAGALFGVEGNATRVALARLVASGQVVSDERGRYRLGAGMWAQRRVGAWRQLDDEARRWSGAWIGIHAGPVARVRARRDRQGREWALRLLGFRHLTSGLAVRPDNLRRGIDALRGELVAQGLPPGDLVFVVSAFDAVTEARARALWDVAGLRATYRSMRAQLAKSARRLDRLEAREAMVESFRLGGRVIRQLVLDPRLPEAICPGAEREALRAALQQYDRLGRVAWAAFLKRYDVPHMATDTPADTRLASVVRRRAL